MLRLLVCAATAMTVAMLTAPLARAQGGEVARGPAGVLTQDAVAAYIEALEFVLAQIGQPTSFPPEARGQIEQEMAAAFPGLPVEVQTDLVNGRAIWSQYRAQWDGLDLPTRQTFAYYVLALAYGEDAAAQALGISPQEAAGPAPSGEEGYSPSVDDLMGPVPGSDCWGSAGCTSYDPSTNTYTYE